MAYNPFTVDYNPENMNTGFAGLSAGIQAYGQKKKEEGLLAQRQQKLANVSEMLEAGDFSGVNKFMTMNPELAKHVKSQQGYMDDRTEKLRLDAMGRTVSGGDVLENAVKLKENLISLGANTDQVDSIIEMANEDPEDAREYIGKLFPILAPKDVYDNYSKMLENNLGGGKLGTVSPKDFTVESMTDYAETGDISSLERYRPAVKNIADIPHQVNPLTDRWEPIVDLNSSGISEQAKALAEIEAEKQSKLDFEAAKSKFHNNETGFLSKIK